MKRRTHNAPARGCVVRRSGRGGGSHTGHNARRLIDGSDTNLTDHFLLMAEDWMPHGAFALHPHRGIEMLTLVIEGTVDHFDTSGRLL